MGGAKGYMLQTPIIGVWFQANLRIRSGSQARATFLVTISSTKFGHRRHRDNLIKHPLQHQSTVFGALCGV